MDATWLPSDWAAWSPSQMFGWLASQAHFGPQKVRRAVRRYVEQQFVAWQVKTLHGDIRKTLLDHSTVFDEPPCDVPPPPGVSQCHRCGASFASARQLANHMWTKHQQPSAERQFMPSDVCLHCGTCFWTSQRLQQHLRYSRRTRDGCYSRITWTYQPLQYGSVRLPPALQGHLRIPAAPTAGPANDPALQPQTEEEAVARIDHLWNRLDLPRHIEPECQQQVWQRVREIICQSCENGDPCPSTLVEEILHAVHHMEDEDGSVDSRTWALILWFKDCCRASLYPQMSGSVFAAFYEDLECTLLAVPMAQLLFWKWRICDSQLLTSPDDVQQVSSNRRLKEHIPDHLFNLTAALEPIVQPILRCPCRHTVPVQKRNHKPFLWILHMFSGRRRWGDIHEWVLYFATQLLPDFEIKMVSCDTAVSQLYGDLSPGHAFDHLHRLVRLGLFAGSIAGPPCETWSAARWEPVQLPDGSTRPGPRPLRTVVHPWGTRFLTLRELRQVGTGSVLLLHTWLLETGIALQGGGCVKEHPSEPVRAEAASTWTTRTHEQWIMRLHEACRHHILQYHYGSVAVKPTDLRVLNLGSPESTLNDLSLGADWTRTRPSQVLLGRGQDGTYRTAAAKEYPIHLSRSIAFCLINGLRRRIREHGTHFCPDLPRNDEEWLWAAMRASAAQSAQATFLPDYQGQ
eukprot:Skav222185  [mRNA]  locus=scaffold3784:94010:96064:+ [translate_table: standard]